MPGLRNLPKKPQCLGGSVLQTQPLIDAFWESNQGTGLRKQDAFQRQARPQAVYVLRSAVFCLTSVIAEEQFRLPVKDAGISCAVGGVDPCLVGMHLSALQVSGSSMLPDSYPFTCWRRLLQRP